MDILSQVFAMDTPRQTYAQRAALSSTPPLADYLLRLMERKQSNICLAAESADGMTTAELLKVAADCGDSIVVLKLHSDAVWDLSPETVRDLTLLAKQKGFLLFDDRIFSGTSPSVAAQYSATHLHPGSWTSLTSAHIFHGTKVVKILRDAAVELISNMQPEDQDCPQPHPYKQRSQNDSSSYFSTRQSFDYAETSPTRSKHVRPQHPAGSRHASNPSRNSFLSEAALAEAYQAAGQRPPLHRKGSGNPTRQPLSPSMAAVAPFDRRKSSIVSINTTISSSTEYIGSPSNANPRVQPCASITMSASSPNISPGRDEASQQNQDNGPPLSRGILLNTDIDPAIFQQGSVIGAYAADSCTNGFKRACAKVARIDRDFVLGFVSDGHAAAQANGSGSELTKKFLNFVSNCCFADDSLYLSRQRKRVSESTTPTRASQTNGNESSEEEPDDSDTESSDSDGHASRSSVTFPVDVSPAALVRDQRADVLIVGAPIIQAMDKREAVERYRKAGWQAYLQDVGRTKQPAAAK